MSNICNTNSKYVWNLLVKIHIISHIDRTSDINDRRIWTLVWTSTAKWRKDIPRLLCWSNGTLVLDVKKCSFLCFFFNKKVNNFFFISGSVWAMMNKYIISGFSGTQLRQAHGIQSAQQLVPWSHIQSAGNFVDSTAVQHQPSTTNRTRLESVPPSSKIPQP